MAESKSAQQVREITDKLEQGIKELFESERFKEYLRTMSKFYHYSFSNTLLIAIEDQNPLSFVVEKLKINIDLQFLNQAHAGTLRLVKSRASDHAAGSLVCDAKYQLAAAIVRQSTAALRRLSKVKAIFGFLELDVFALFGFQKLLDSF